MNAERMNELFNNNTSSLKICVGSWKAYTERNKHALGAYYNGSFFLDFEVLESRDELYEVLKFLGWSDAECEELFIQDYEGDLHFENCDFISPASVIAYIVDNDVDLSRDAKKISAIMEYTGDSFEEACEEVDNYDFYEDKTAEEYEEDLINDCYPDIAFDKLGWLSNYITIDYEQMARDDDSIYEVNGGLLVRC